ncbi:thiolase domain-containing protein [candidate division KSB1 bacterium]|nr:thiolase domain-containing protein [candidate division KSB1 bacterium]
MRDVAVIGVGLNKWGELWEMSLREIFVDAALKAMDDAGVDKIDSLYVGSMSPGLFVGQEHLASMLADYLGQCPIPAARVESACASGGLAFRTGWMEVALGLSDVVMVSGVEKMLDVDGGAATYTLATAADQEYEGYNGATFPGLYAMIANAYAKKYKIPADKFRQQLSAVTVKNHANGFLNSNAQFRMKLTMEDTFKSTMVADPLRLYDCSPITDGAAACILAPIELAKKKFKNHPIVAVIGTGAATDTIALHDREDLTYLKSTEIAAKHAYKMANIDDPVKQIQLAEVHDCFTIAEICTTEALGFFAKGKGGEAALSGATARDGKMPINTSGGLKSKGHPVGATGIAQVIEIVQQLRGEAGERQLKKAKVGLTQNMGGSGGSAIVHILKSM